MSGAPAPGGEEQWSERRPRPGDLAPAPGALDFRPHVERQQHREWEAAHIAWLNANGLTWSYEELGQWWDHPDRDRLPMPGMLEWQQRISQQYSVHADVIGVQPAYPATVPALDAASARQARELRQAREADAERIAWLENAVTRAATELSDSAARRAELVDHIGRQDDTIRAHVAEARRLDTEIQEHRQAIAEKDAEIARQANVIRQKDAAINRHQDDADKLTAAMHAKDDFAERLGAAITQLETANRQLTARIRGKEDQIRELETSAAQAAPPGESGALLALRNHEQVARWQADLISDLRAGVQKLRDQVAELQDRNDRLSDRLLPRTGLADQAQPTSTSITIDSR
jgi:peptidoglycan hydrolase CwlO-like protein